MGDKQKTHRICEICGVRERHKSEKLFFARYPLDEHRCKEWLRVTGKQDLVHLPIEKLHQLRYVCGKHFTKKDFTKTGIRLRKRAVPKLHLTATPLTEDCFAEFPLHIAKDPTPSSSTQQAQQDIGANLATTQLVSVSNGAKRRKVEIVITPDPIPSTSTQQAQEHIGANLATTQFVSVSSSAKRQKPEAVISPDPIPSTSTQQAQENIGANFATTQFVSVSNGAKRRKIEVVINPGAVLSMSTQRDANVVNTQSAMSNLANEAKQRKTLAPVNIENTVPEGRKVETSAEGNTANVVDIQSAMAMSSRDSERRNASVSVETQDLGTREKELLQQLKEAKSTIKSLKKNAKLIDDIQSPILKEIVTMALKNQKRKPRGRRWTTKYKISLLAIFKRSPKAYRYLKHLIPLPSTNTLQNILKKVPMDTGICKQTLQYLKKQKKNTLDKYCCLLFDEMAIKPRLIYNYAADKVEGYTDMGNGERSQELADHALVFMLQGLRKKYKQPIAFYFVKGTVSSAKLATLIRDIILAITETGYHVMATVCDQGPTNMGALKILKGLSLRGEENTPDQNYFKVNEQNVYIVYDVPHLIKSIRNNFLNYGVMKMNGQTAQWQHLLKVEEKNRNLLYLSKISQTHVQPKYRARMKVKYAAQLLSNTVAAVLKLLALAEKDPIESNKIMETGIIVQQLDKLFDYTNGPSGPNDIKNGLRVNVSAKTDHIKVWAEYRKMLETVSFVKPQSGARAKNVRCIQVYLTTLRSLRDIWTNCQSLGFKYLNLRQLNQDALENLFGVLRQHSPTNKNPTVSSFIAGIKTAVVSKMTGPHSRGSNCQKDTNTLLTDFHDLVFSNEHQIKDDAENEKENKNNNETENDDNTYPVLSIPDDIEEEEKVQEQLINIDIQPVVYLSGYIVHNIFKNHKCNACSEVLITKDPSDASTTNYEYIKLREWWQDKRSLTYPSDGMCRYVQVNVNAFEKHVIMSMHVLDIRAFTITIFLANSDASFIKCSQHHGTLSNTILTCLALLLIRRQSGRVNQRLSIEEENVKDIVKKSQQRGVDKDVL